MRHKKVEAVFSSGSTDLNPQLVIGISAFPKQQDISTDADMSLAAVDECLYSEEEKEVGEERSFSSSDDEDFNFGKVSENFMLSL